MTDWITHKIQSTQASKLESLSTLLDSYNISGIEEIDNGLLVYYQDDCLTKDIEALAQQLDLDCNHTIEVSSSKNWNAEWESNFQPVEIDKLCIIYAHFHQVDANAFKYKIQITPQMSFGTGHHATTRMMIRTMHTVGFNRKSVFDFGTGTGILAIFAKLLGAEEVIAIDNSNWAISNSMENAKINQVSTIQFLEADHAALPGQTFDIILVNIIRSVIFDNLSILDNQLTPGGHLILSGYLKQDGGKMKYEVQKRGYQLIAETSEDNWLCHHFQKAHNA